MQLLSSVACVCFLPRISFAVGGATKKDKRSTEEVAATREEESPTEESQEVLGGEAQNGGHGGTQLVVFGGRQRRRRRRRRRAIFEAGRLEVLVEVGLERERLVAASAAEVLEARMRLHVCAQVGAVGERLAAVGAAKRLLAGVRAHVTLQEPGPRERLAAHGALVAQVVRQHVHGQRRHGHVHLGARRALLGQLRVRAAVRLLVARQVRRGRVVFATLAARVARPLWTALGAGRAVAALTPAATVGQGRLIFALALRGARLGHHVHIARHVLVGVEVEGW